jgi:hypothetical protein
MRRRYTPIVPLLAVLQEGQGRVRRNYTSRAAAPASSDSSPLVHAS